MVDKKSIFNLNTGISLKHSKETKLNPKVRKYNCQNFTSILNTPKTSIFSDIKKKILNNSTNFDLELRYCEKFFEDSGYSNTESSSWENKSVGSNKSSSIPLKYKDYLYADYTEYLNYINKAFTTYNSNHKRKKRGTAVELSLNINKETQITEFHEDEFNYESNIQNAKSNIGEMFFSEKYKITYLNLGIEDIVKTTMDLQMKGNYAEKETNKILVNSNHIYNYISSHKHFYNQVSDCLETIFFTKVKFAKIKHRYIDNGIKQIYLKKRKDKLTELQSFFDSLKLLRKLSFEINELEKKSKENISPIQIKEYEIQLANILNNDNCNTTKLNQLKIVQIIKSKLTIIKQIRLNDSLQELLKLIEKEITLEFNLISCDTQIIENEDFLFEKVNSYFLVNSKI